MATHPSPPYGIAVHPRFAETPFDDLPKWLQNRLDRYDTSSAGLEDDDEVVDDDDEDEPVEGPVEVEEPVEDTDTEDEYPRHKGGGWYELSDGSSVQGEDDAIEAEAALADGNVDD